MDKKKSKTTKRASLSTEKEKHVEKTPVPVMAPMVVEVEEEAAPVSEPAMAKIEKDTEAVEAAAQKLEDDIEKELDKTEPEPSKPPVTEVLPEREKTKAVVKEFFKGGGLPPEIPAYKNKGSKSLLLWAVIVLVVAGLTGTGLTMLVKGKGFKLPSFSVAPKQTLRPTPTPEILVTPTPTLLRSDLNIQVLNGSGVAGAGSKMKEFLVSKGYKVGDTGNANSFDFQNTEILVKAGKEPYIPLLQNDLKDSYSVGTAAATLSPDSSFDAQIIVGQQ